MEEKIKEEEEERREVRSIWSEGGNLSNAKRAPGCLGFFVGDEILPSYIGIIS